MKQPSNLNALMALYQGSFSPEAQLRQRAAEVELASSPLRYQQMQEALRSAELGNTRVEQLMPLEVQGATLQNEGVSTQNRLASLMVDPTVEARVLQNRGLEEQNRAMNLENTYADRTMSERIRRPGLENSGLFQQTKSSILGDQLAQAEFRQGTTEAEQRAQALRQSTAMSLAQFLTSLNSSPKGIGDAMKVLSNANFDVPEPFAEDVQFELNMFKELEPRVTSKSLDYYGPRIASVVEKDPRAMLELGPKIRAIYAAYLAGKRTAGDLTETEKSNLDSK